MSEIDPDEARRRPAAGVDATSLAGGLRAYTEHGGALVRDDGSPGTLDG